MTAEEQFQSYKADFDKRQLIRARTTSIVLGLATVVGVLGMLYGLINNIEATAQSDVAIKNEQDAITAKLETDKLRTVANDLNRENADLKSQLAICKSGK